MPSLRRGIARGGSRGPDDLHFNLYHRAGWWKMGLWDARTHFMVDGGPAGAKPWTAPISSSTACCSASEKTPPATTTSPPWHRPPGDASRPASGNRQSAGQVLAAAPDPRPTHGAQSSRTIALAETPPSLGTRTTTAPHRSVR